VHDNKGPGLWSDGDNINTSYEDNYVSNNGFEGIVYEISYDALIKNNVVVNNGFSTKSGWLDGAGILIEASPNAEVVGNLVVGNWNGIGITQAARGSGLHGPHEVHDVHVHDNVVVMQRGQTGMAQGVNDPSYFTTKNNRFARNRYYIGCMSEPFAWRSPRSRELDGRLTIADWAAVGNDRDGLIVSTCGS
jgi:parallel beta-helix repeat protein